MFQMKPILLTLFYNFFISFLYKYGAIFLFVSLMVGIVGLPIPDEILLIGAGYLMAHQKLNIAATIFCAVLGSMCGITVSYLFGRWIGGWMIRKFGKTLRITPERIALTQIMFDKIGKWLLIIAYFVPLLRHIVGFVAGGAKVNFKHFALFAFAGAVIWSLTFLGIGYFFNDWFKHIFNK
jgi:membrane protein DedA with SNARE-associated domain